MACITLDSTAELSDLWRLAVGCGANPRTQRIQFRRYCDRWRSADAHQRCHMSDVRIHLFRERGDLWCRSCGAESDGAGEGRIVNSNLQGLQGLSQQKAAFSTSVKMPREEAIPVRTTDLKHLKRDIRRIPDGNGKLDNAFWCAIGIGIPMIIQFVVDSSSSGGHGNWLILAIGVVSCILAGMFKIFGKGEKEERERYIDDIIENIDDFSVGVR